MGKGGMSQGEKEDGEEVNMAAWLLGVNTLKIQPFELPSLGIVDARFWLLFRPRSGSLFDQLNHDQDLSSYAFFSKYSCVHKNKSEHTGCFPGVNPPTLKSDMKVFCSWER
ncbi:hypothetical protein WN944_024040 [Citrus x changshan-huyou]|uniref:Uncharacterized protein n=1 Tax=Citrus x changshan-huyou TaxID=2935761 RepID=A0AAP0QBM5_9ROSI